MSLASEQYMPNTWLFACASPASRSEIGTAAFSGFSGSAFRPRRWRRSMPLEIASTTSLSLPPAAVATAFARVSDTETPQNCARRIFVC